MTRMSKFWCLFSIVRSVGNIFCLFLLSSHDKMLSESISIEQQTFVWLHRWTDLGRFFFVVVLLSVGGLLLLVVFSCWLVWLRWWKCRFFDVWQFCCSYSATYQTVCLFVCDCQRRRNCVAKSMNLIKMIIFAIELDNISCCRLPFFQMSLGYQLGVTYWQKACVHNESCQSEARVTRAQSTECERWNGARVIEWNGSLHFELYQKQWSAIIATCHHSVLCSIRWPSC